MYQTDYDFAPRGWVCPKCGRIYSPSTPMCFYCNNTNQQTTTYGTGTTPNAGSTTPIPNDKGFWNTYLRECGTTNTSTEIDESSYYWDNKIHALENVLNNISNETKENKNE